MGKLAAFTGFAIVGALLTGADAGAAVSYYNSFSTPAGGNVTSPGLDYPDLVTAGNKVTIGSYSNSGYSLPEALGGNGTVTYISFLLSGVAQGRHELGLSGGTSFGYPELPAFGTSGGEYKILNGETGGPGGNFANTGGGSYSGTGTHLIVVKIDQAADTISLFANPTVGAAEPTTPTVGISNSPDFTFPSFRFFNSDAGASYDEVRIGDTFADVTPGSSATPVPEPTALGLVGAAAGLLSLRRRRLA